LLGGRLARGRSLVDVRGIKLDLSLECADAALVRLELFGERLVGLGVVLKLLLEVGDLCFTFKLLFMKIRNFVLERLIIRLVSRLELLLRGCFRLQTSTLSPQLRNLSITVLKLRAQITHLLILKHFSALAHIVVAITERLNYFAELIVLFCQQIVSLL
jgi:hypothetical protein